MRVLMVVGARPNFVKAAPLLEAMRRRPDMETVLVHTGQHYDYEMSRVFFDQLGMRSPDVNLEVGSGSPVRQVAEIMLRLESVMDQTQPDLMLVVGDVNSTLAGALTAVKTGRPIAHVEAGLRSFDRAMPEEVNRVLTDAISDFLFVTEPAGVENLLNEGRPKDRIFHVGNVMIDALQHFLPHARRYVLAAPHPLANQPLNGRFGLVTLHRPSTVDDLPTLSSIWGALAEIATEVPLIFPIHPRTQARMTAAGLTPPRHGAGNGLRLVPPLSYLHFLKLLSEAAVVITDSGGVQEETTALGVPCLTVRENTERPITLTEGTNVLVGLGPQRLLVEARKVLRGEARQGRVPELWDGHAAERIVDILTQQVRVPEREPVQKPQFRSVGEIV